MSMRNQSLFAAVFTLLLTSTTVLNKISAQTNYQIGVTFGSNYSSLKSDQFATAAGRLGVAAGASVVVGFGKRFELNQEVSFVQKGADARAIIYMPEEKIENTAYAYHYNTFETGLFAGFQPIADVPVKLQLGGFFGMNANNLNRDQYQVMVRDYNNVNNALPAFKLNEAFSGVDYGPAFGISAGSGRFRLNARYYMGACNLYNNLDFVEKGPFIRSQSARITLTYFVK
jgi:Outer membrane protein beta-barrel domain